MNILVIEDQPLIAKAVVKTLSDIPSVNVLDTACDFKSALQKASSDIYDLFIVDICLGDDEHNGLDICSFIRKRNTEVPIVITTSLHSLKYLERAFGMRINDYITKPFHPKELLLRVKRWSHVSKPTSGFESIDYQELSYDAKQHVFIWKGETLTLSKRNKDLLLLFLREPEKLLSKRYLKEKYWGDLADKPRNLRASIQDLRKALDGACSSWISTVRGEGYVFQKTDGSDLIHFS